MISNNKKYSVIIVAGGRGLRAGGILPKQFQCIGGKPMLMHTIQAFYDFDKHMRIVVVVPPEFLELWDSLCAEYLFDIYHLVVTGGKTRFHSVKNGLREITDKEIVGIHDGARPFVSHDLIDRCYRETGKFLCGTVPVIDEKHTVRIISENSSKHVNRTELKVVQTPQVFPAFLIKQAYQADYKPYFTDDASVMEQYGIDIHLVPGDDMNIKITTTLDLKFAEFLMERNRS